MPTSCQGLSALYLFEYVWWPGACHFRGSTLRDSKFVDITTLPWLKCGTQRHQASTDARAPRAGKSSDMPTSCQGLPALDVRGYGWVA
jgi:hypothetical protein